ncbi:MAG: tyrosine--tRNA ligase [Candidatus Moranbacteria bacterium]|nr:tyrosine--tRNA ligase [Candidatus Moranbacteria bacterium]
MDKQELEKKLDDIFKRGVGEFIDPDDVFRKKLIAKAEGKYDKDIIIKYGVDPTRPDIHLGHAVCFWKLRQLQDLGCKVVFLVGDFTAQIGDPTGKSKVRPELEQEAVEKNMQTYLEQIDRILKVNEKNFSWIRNSDWYVGMESVVALSNEDVIIPDAFGGSIRVKPSSYMAKTHIWENSKMQKNYLKIDQIYFVTFVSFLSTLRRITHARLIERDMFRKRIGSGEQLYMHEMMYPVLQGMDSNVLFKIYGSCDLEVGGTDQTFNMLMGRDVMEIEKQPAQSVLSIDLLVGTDGAEKMSKSLDNYIAITDEPKQMFGKIMSVPDAVIANYFELCTNVPMEEIKKLETQMAEGKLNPRDAKLQLASEIVKIYHSQIEAEKAKEYFIKTISNKEAPAEVTEFKIETKEIKMSEFLVASGNATSISDARRKVEQGGVSVDGEKILDPNLLVDASFEGKVFKIGKLGWIKVKF